MDSNGNSPTEQHSPPDEPQAPRAYHSKRPHRKSRTGCRTCKTRKVKCDEGRPSCRNCTLRQTTCVYVTTRPAANSRSPAANSHSSPEPTTASRTSRKKSSSTQNGSPSSRDYSNGTPTATEEDPTSPPPIAASVEPHDTQFFNTGFDGEDMKLMWWYSTYGYLSFSTGPLGQPASVNRVLQIDIPQLAFQPQNRFLMDMVLSLSACHMATMQQDMSIQRAAAYRGRAFNSYKRAVMEMKPETRPAILAASLFLTAVETQAFREPNTPPLYIINWISIWRGIGDVFFRPVLNLAAASDFIPEELSQLIASIPKGHPEYPIKEYHELTLKFLGALHAELLNGLAPITQILITTWSTYLPQPTVNAMRQRQPYSLIILAHYLPFLRLVDSWWLEGITSHEIPGIIQTLGPDWANHPALDVPILSLQVTDKLQLAKLLLRDGTYDFPPLPTVVQRGGEVVGFSSLMSLKTLPQRPKTPSLGPGLLDPQAYPSGPQVGQ
ncbi:unnamed protein product [Parascedosporium putredinis]|uniref:Zn(2)-C6 fungal-type domain-containing protein n=1 Tax=Parascedosporium putredinis TaxID=1442378 RepID=A0A9P1M6Q0_9PEZI|nr:unnamed protein product [Parascedosporium putredinis]CAI7988850.1 unnamed protein product [Parascedosporium putredinis]